MIETGVRSAADSTSPFLCHTFRDCLILTAHACAHSRFLNMCSVSLAKQSANGESRLSKENLEGELSRTNRLEWQIRWLHPGR